MFYDKKFKILLEINLCNINVGWNMKNMIKMFSNEIIIGFDLSQTAA